MRYCPKCKKIYSDQKDKCDCGIELIKNIKLNANDPVFLINACSLEKDRIKSVLSDYNLPFEERVLKKQLSAEFVTGNGNDLVNIYVPFCEFNKAKDLIIGIVADKNIAEFEDIQEVSFNKKDETEEMDPQKRFIWRIISLVLFLLLIWLAVAGTDYIMALIKELIK